MKAVSFILDPNPALYETSDIHCKITPLVKRSVDSLVEVLMNQFSQDKSFDILRSATLLLMNFQKYS